MKCCEYSPRSCIHNILFSLLMMYQSNKLECYITLGWKGLPVANALRYLASLSVTREKSFIRLAPGANVIKLFTDVYKFS